MRKKSQPGRQGPSDPSHLLTQLEDVYQGNRLWSGMSRSRRKTNAMVVVCTTLKGSGSNIGWDVQDLLYVRKDRWVASMICFKAPQLRLIPLFCGYIEIYSIEETDWLIELN